MGKISGDTRTLDYGSGGFFVTLTIDPTPGPHHYPQPSQESG